MISPLTKIIIGEQLKQLLIGLLIILTLGFSSVAYSYILQVGDMVRIYLPGEDDLDKNYNIDYEGRIVLPEVGDVKIVGLSENEAKQVIAEKLSLIYKDLESLSVYVEKRQLLITVSGYVEKPGRVSLDVTADIQMALIAAGGLRSGAQLDKIQLRRPNKLIIINYKAYLDSGDISLLPEIQSGDILFVPASPKMGNVEMNFDVTSVADAGDAAEDKAAIKIFGEVNKPGSYSYKQDATIIDMLMRAGGVTRYAGVTSIRLIANSNPQKFDLKEFLNTGKESLLPIIKPGVTIFVPMKEAKIKTGVTTIYIMGEVFKPGAYEGKEGMSFMDILANAGGPTRFAESRQIRIIRANGKVTKFDLSAYTEGLTKQTMPTVAPGDAIFVPEKTDMNEKSWTKIAPSRAILVMGAVNKPGRYEWSSEMTLLDLLAHAGGANDLGDTSKIDLNIRLPNGERNHRLFDLDRFISEGKRDHELPKLYAGSIVKVNLFSKTTENRSDIKIFGEVKKPGSYPYKKHHTIIDVLMLAGGVTRYAGVTSIRLITHGIPQFFDLKEYLDTGKETLLPTLSEGIIIFVPMKETKIKTGATTIYIMGEVFKPGAYEGQVGVNFMDILANAGGPTRFAESREIRIIRANGEVVTFDLLAFTEGLSQQTIPLVTAGDAIYVPEKTDMNEKSWTKIAPSRAIHIMGAVNKPGRYEWSDEMSLLDLLAHAGGANERGDTSKIRLNIRMPNGQRKHQIFDLDAFMNAKDYGQRLPKLYAGSVVKIDVLPHDPTDQRSEWILQSTNQSIYLFGEVRAPGRYRFENKMSFLDILSAAQGPTANADLQNIRINHRNGQYTSVSKLNLALYFETGDDSLLPTIRTEDTIYIPSRKRNWLEKSKESTVRVLGRINKPGRYPFNDKMTLLDLLAEAGGTAEGANLKNITIVNKECCEDGNRSRHFNLELFLSGSPRYQLPSLRAGDTVFITDEKHSWLSRTRRTIKDLVSIISLFTLVSDL